MFAVGKSACATVLLLQYRKSSRGGSSVLSNRLGLNPDIGHQRAKFKVEYLEGSATLNGIDEQASAVETCARPCDWLHFAGRANAAGRDWTRMYGRYAAGVEFSNQALELMRRGRLEEGVAKLKQFACSLDALGGDVSSSVRAVMNRWYYGVAAYHSYCLGDLAEADRSMCLAHEAIVEALSEADFLMLLSVHCQEFCLHQARIARNARNWTKLNDYLERARAMTEDRLPLCETRSGQRIYFSTISEFLRSVGPLSAAEKETVRGIVEEDERKKLFENFVRRLMRIPDFAIAYQ